MMHRSRSRWLGMVSAGIVACGGTLISGSLFGDPRGSVDREDDPPRVVEPGTSTRPPSDAVVLFDGSSLEGWTSVDGSPARWTVEAGAMVVNGTGSIRSTHMFKDAQIHIEFATPAEVAGEGQGRGNSGVYIQGRYEVQVLDSYGNETYADGQCGAIYGQHAPLVNASRPPGVWQTYDIIFRGARFDASGRKTEPARITVLHNGVVIHDHAEASGPTGASLSRESPEPGPLLLQDHGNPVRFRNVWVRELD